MNNLTAEFIIKRLSILEITSKIEKLAMLTGYFIEYSKDNPKAEINVKEVSILLKWAFSD